MRLTEAELFKLHKLLGQDVAENEPFLQITACMEKKWRKTIAYLEILKILYPKDAEVKKDVDDFLIPICQKIGMSLWDRDIFTDLAMKIGTKQKWFSAKHKK